MSSFASSLWAPLLPWVLFVVADRNLGVGPEKSALVGAGTAIILLWLAIRLDRPRALPGVGVALFTALSIALWFLGDSPGRHYHRSIVTGVLASVLTLSCLTSPLTLTYLRDRVPAGRSVSADFVRANRRLTLCWSACTAGAAISFAIGSHYRDGGPTTIWNWFVPITMAVVASALTNRLMTKEDIRNGSASPKTMFALFEAGPSRRNTERHLSVLKPGLPIQADDDLVAPVNESGCLQHPRSLTKQASRRNDRTLTDGPSVAQAVH